MKNKELEPKFKFQDLDPSTTRGIDFFKLLDKALKEIYKILNELKGAKNG